LYCFLRRSLHSPALGGSQANDVVDSLGRCNATNSHAFTGKLNDSRVFSENRHPRKCWLFLRSVRNDVLLSCSFGSLRNDVAILVNPNELRSSLHSGLVDLTNVSIRVDGTGTLCAVRDGEDGSILRKPLSKLSISPAVKILPNLI